MEGGLGALLLFPLKCVLVLKAVNQGPVEGGRPGGLVMDGLLSHSGCDDIK